MKVLSTALRTNLASVLVLLLTPVSVAFAEGPPASVMPTNPEVEVPFGCGYAFPVSQTHNIGSHLQNDSWAWDFRMPEGTPVTAARDGVVRLARGDSSEGGCDPRFAPLANYVVVDHGNGLETQYLHFSAVTVKAGDRVHAGDLLGYSGKTGWACGAHLHFKVAHPVSVGWNNPSVPARLSGYGDPTLESVVAAPICGEKTFFASRPPATATPPAAVQAALASVSSSQPTEAKGSSAAPTATLHDGHTAMPSARAVPAVQH